MDIMANDHTGSRAFGPIRIRWTFDIDGARCAIDVVWKDQSIAKQTLDALRPVLNFNIRTESAPYERASGEIAFNASTGLLMLRHLSYPGGSEHEVWLAEARPLPPPPIPPIDDDASDVEQSIVSEAGDLFPYIHLRDWPQATEQALADRFIFYAATCAADDPRLYCRLLAIDRKQPDARAQMLKQALAFVQGEQPYHGQFARCPSAIGPEFAALAEFTVTADRIDIPTVPALIELIVDLWGQPWPAIVEVLGSTAFADGMDRAWQNVFALDCVLGYDRGSLAGMIYALVAARLLQRIAGSAEDHAAWPPHRLREGLGATLVLPSPVFPLPAALPPIVDGPEPITVLPYAIGNLHLVKRRLLGYSLGEVSHIESVMADEKKVRAQHELVEDESRRSSHATQHASHDDERTGNGMSLESQVRKTLLEQFQVDYTTNYGPPTESKQSGSYTLKPIGTAPTREGETKQTNLARRITERAAQRVSSGLSEQRLQHRRHARHSETSQCFDRRGRSDNQRGIYRWLDARYRCWVVRIGRRLMLEYFVPHPAARFKAAQHNLSGIDLSEPLSPARRGVRQFHDISLDPLSDLYYATLSATYAVDANPPPPEHAYVSAVFETGTPLLSQSVALPSGYATDTATVAPATDTTGLTASGWIGTTDFAVTGDGQARKQTVALAAQTDSLPVSVVIGGDAGTFGLHVEVNLLRTETLVSTWKSQLYDRLMDGYRRQLARYLEVAGVTPARRIDPQVRRGDPRRTQARGYARLPANSRRAYRRTPA